MADFSTQGAGPLAPLNLRVVASTHILAGPYALYRLRALGVKDIIVVENPKNADGARKYGPWSDPDADVSQSLYHAALNSGNQFVTLDLKGTADKRRMLNLLAGADVYLYNQRKPVMDGLELSYTKLSASADHRHLKHVHISGDRHNDEGAYDNAALAESGFAPALCNVNGVLYSPPLSLADMSSGVTASEALLAAIINDLVTGDPKGEYIEVSMVNAVANFFAMAMAGATRRIKPSDPKGLDPDHPSIAPFAPYSCGGGWDEKGGTVPKGVFMLNVGTDPHFQTLAEILKFSDLDKMHFAGNKERHIHRELLRNKIEEALADREDKDWVKTFNDAGIVAKLAKPVSVVVADRQKAGVEDQYYIKVVDEDGQTAFLRPMPGAYFHHSGLPVDPVKLAPATPGADNDKIFAALDSGEYRESFLANRTVRYAHAMGNAGRGLTERRQRWEGPNQSPPGQTRARHAMHAVI